MKNGLIINNYEDKFWYTNDRIHRDGDLPALEYDDGDKCLYKEGKLHREGDLPVIQCPDGRKEWYYKGKKLEERRFTSSRMQ